MTEILAALTSTGRTVLIVEIIVAVVLAAALIAVLARLRSFRKREQKRTAEQVKVYRSPEAPDEIPPPEEAAPSENDSSAEADKPASDLEDALPDLYPGVEATPTLREALKGVSEHDDEDDKSDSDAQEGPGGFPEKLADSSPLNKAIYNALKNKLLSYRSVRSRVVRGGDYFRRPGKPLVKLVLIGKTLRMAIALDPADYDYNIYHQKDRGGMKKYAETPMFVKVQSRLGVQRALKLIEDLAAIERFKRNRQYRPLDYSRALTYAVRNGIREAAEQREDGDNE